jgi:hypothetical protein
MVQYTLEQHVFLYDMWNTDLLERVGKNYVMKELPADKQFTIW